ncbi:alpha/beta hydrolase [Microbacterium sp. BWT-B31]|uniref:alpha/beta hydrolase n=1 Tax=Microbacterium sp. BWT-B31 TaxID=3232072 RepID=UPI0035276E65
MAGLATASLVLSGCLYSMIPESQPSPTKSPDTENVAAELLPYYGQSLTWDSCGDEFECATVVAPLDWQNPGDRDIDLAIIRHRATGQSQGALFINPGGPGASGVDFVRDSITYATSERLRAAYDIVGFDPRGVQASTAVQCFDAPAMDSFLFDIPAGERNSDQWTAELEAANADFAQACDENSDGILPFITTENAARDLDLLRAVLGERTLTYLGYSYGTSLGATYANLFPERAGRLVLDGAVDPSIPSLDIGTTQIIGFESALRAYMADCLSGDDCPFSGTVDDALADLNTLYASVDRSPIPAADGRLLGADSLNTSVITALYSQENWPYLTQALTDVLAGDAEFAFILADFYYDRENGVYTTNSTEAFMAYNCMDYPLDATDEEQAAAEALMRAEAPTIAEFNLGPDPCEQWPYPPTGVREPITAEGAAPIVVVGTTNDPATPYAWSVSLAEQLSSGVLVTRVGEGHTGYNKGNACVDDAIDSFFIDATVPEDGLRCE